MRTYSIHGPEVKPCQQHCKPRMQRVSEQCGRWTKVRRITTSVWMLVRHLLRSRSRPATRPPLLAVRRLRKIAHQEHHLGQRRQASQVTLPSRCGENLCARRFPRKMSWRDHCLLEPAALTRAVVRVPGKRVQCITICSFCSAHVFTARRWGKSTPHFHRYMPFSR